MFEILVPVGYCLLHQILCFLVHYIYEITLVSLLITGCIRAKVIYFN